jgi:hypothetical protein
MGYGDGPQPLVMNLLVAVLIENGVTTLFIEGRDLDLAKAFDLNCVAELAARLPARSAAAVTMNRLQEVLP